MNTSKYYIGRSGRFNVTPPFNNLVKENVVYKVKQDSLITELLRDRVHIYDIVYKIIGISKEDYEIDVKNDVRVLTLVDSSNNNIYIPVHYIVGGCIRDGVEYADRTVLVNLGGFPVNFDFDALLTNIGNTVKNSVGVVPKYELLETSLKEMVGNTEHTTLTTARENIKNVNPIKDMDETLAEIAKLKKTISDLECVIKNKVVV